MSQRARRMAPAAPRAASRSLPDAGDHVPGLFRIPLSLLYLCAMTHREAIALLDNPLLRGLTGRTGMRTSAAPATTAGLPGNLNTTNAASPSIAHPPLHWADLGCGAGTFTFAIAHYLPSGSTIDAIDLNPSIAKQTTDGGVTILPRAADFNQPTPGVKKLDGIIMANALHYVKNQPALLQSLHAALKPGGIFLLVEYDTDTPVPRWVPYPLSFVTATRLFTPPCWQSLQKGNQRPSAFGRSTIFSAYTTAS